MWSDLPKDLLEALDFSTNLNIRYKEKHSKKSISVQAFLRISRIQSMWQTYIEKFYSKKEYLDMSELARVEFIENMLAWWVKVQKLVVIFYVESHPSILFRYQWKSVLIKNWAEFRGKKTN